MKGFNKIDDRTKGNVKALFMALLIAVFLAGCGSGGGGGNGTTKGIGPAGGTVTSSDGKASVMIPPGALSQETDITVETVSSPASGNIGTAYEFGPSGTVFSQPVTISITYDESTLPSVASEQSLSLATFVNNQWAAVSGSTVDTANNIVSGTTTSFSIYGVIVVSGKGEVPSAPTGVAAVGADAQVTISWSPVSGATTYNIYWNTSAGVTTSDNKIPNVTSPHTHTGLTNWMTYYYIVTAVNSVGESSPSDEVSETPISEIAYSSKDLVGTWNILGLITPMRGALYAEHGFDFERVTVENDGSYSLTCIESSHSCDDETGSGLSITEDGMVTAPQDDPQTIDISVMGAGKDVMAGLYAEGNQDSLYADQSFYVALKKAQSYSLPDLVGTWNGAGLFTPRKGSLNTEHGFGFKTLTVENDGSYTLTCIDSSNDDCADDIETGSGASIAEDGTVRMFTDDPDSNNTFIMGAGKDVMAVLNQNSFYDDQGFFIALKKAPSYSMSDLVGTWYMVGIKAPLGNSSAEHGFDFFTMTIESDGSFTLTCIESSDGCSAESDETGSGLSISEDGTVTVPGDPGDVYHTVMNAGKNIMVSLSREGSDASFEADQDLRIFLKKGGSSIDWGNYYNFANNRQWNYIFTAGDTGTVYEYTVEGTANGQDVYIKGWSPSWSDQIDYILRDMSNGLFSVGFRDEDGVDHFFAEPLKFTCNNLNESCSIKGSIDGMNYDLTFIHELDAVTVPAGTFNDCIKTTQTDNLTGQIRVRWHCRDVGLVKHDKVGEFVYELDSITSYRFAGTYSFNRQYDYNIQDGVFLNYDPTTLEVTQNDATNLSIKLTATEGTFSIPLVQSDSIATLSTRPYFVIDHYLLEFLLLSDGNNMVLTSIGQETYDPTDIGLNVANWLRNPEPVTVDSFVGTWSGNFYSDPNIRNTTDGFDVTNEPITISKVDSDTITVNIRNESFLLQVANGRATLTNIPVTGSSAIYHGLSIVTDGTGISVYLVATELNDATDVSVTIGLATKQ